MNTTCEYCSKILSSKRAFERHQTICNLRTIKLLQDQYERELQITKLEIQTQRERYESQLQTQRERYESQLQTQREQHEWETQILKEQLEKFENQIFEIAKQPKENHIHNNNQTTNTHNNQRILNITNQLIPMNLSDDDLKQLVTKYYTTETFLGGPESIAQMTVNHILIDQETGKFRVVCTDTARGIFYFQDADNNLIRDIGMQKIQEKLIAPLNQATLLEFERLEGKNQMNPQRLLDLFGENLSCIRGNELPNRVKKSIQLPIPNTNPTPEPIPITNQEE